MKNYKQKGRKTGCHDPIPDSGNYPAVLTIAGSDSGGGAGIQADLKTFAALGVFGTSAITCVTAQNPDEVAGVEAVSPEMVALQIRTIIRGFPVAAAKTGMLYSASIIRAVCEALDGGGIPALVVDPVMVATSGAKLLRDDAAEELCRNLLPKALVITPNLDEAEILCQHPISSLSGMKSAAGEIGERFGTACVIKGGHLTDSENPAGVTDVLYFRGECRDYSIPRVAAAETHGTGCTFSAALTAFLARGMDLPDSVREAQKFVAGALSRAVPVGSHNPLHPGEGADGSGLGRLR